MPANLSSPAKVRDAICLAIAPSMVAERFIVAPRGRLICQTGADALWPTIELSAMRKHGAIVVDPTLRIYWQTFMEAHWRQSIDLGISNSDVRHFPCVARGFSSLTFSPGKPNEWKDIYVETELDIARAARADRGRVRAFRSRLC
jgi:hypothetical protein